MDNGVDRGSGVRDKATELSELLTNQNKLEAEREFAKKTREKLQGVTGGGNYNQSGSMQGSSYTGPMGGSSAGPVSGNQ